MACLLDGVYALQIKNSDNSYLYNGLAIVCIIRVDKVTAMFFERVEEFTFSHWISPEGRPS